METVYEQKGIEVNLENKILPTHINVSMQRLLPSYSPTAVECWEWEIGEILYLKCFLHEMTALRTQTCIHAVTSQDFYCYMSSGLLYTVTDAHTYVFVCVCVCVCEYI